MRYFLCLTPKAQVQIFEFSETKIETGNVYHKITERTKEGHINIINFFAF